MIFIDRNTLEAPAILTESNGIGSIERAEAVSNFRPGGPQNDFIYKVYRNSEIKEALIILFNKKCAYCESTFLNTYFGDVEHFRPKGEITEALPLKAPGYYWLASNWDNLLLSCKLCNSHKKHKIYGSVLIETLGKMNQFPLHQFQHVRNHTLDIAVEEPYRLLIDPCKDDPELLLSYGKEGNIQSKKSINGLLRKKAETSIRVYALQRIDLVDERKKIRLLIELQQERVLYNAYYFLYFFDTDPKTAASFESNLIKEMQILKKYMAPEMQFAGMAREMIRSFLKEEYDFILAKVV